MNPSNAPDVAVIERLGADSFQSKGERSFFLYRELALAERSNGRYGVRWIRARNQGDLVEPTGWHYHICELQVGLFLRGFIDIQFEDGRETRINGGDCLYLPSGFKHNEIRKSADLEVIQFTIPAVTETIACDPPEMFRQRSTTPA